jgi:TolB protein
MAAAVLVGATALATATGAGGSGGLDGRIAYGCPVDYQHARLDICVARPNGTNVRRLTSSRRNEFDPTWSPTGRRLAFRAAPVGLPPTTSHADIVAIDADGGGRRNLTRNANLDNWSPAWSPDGNLIAFASNRGSDGLERLWLMTPTGRIVRRLTTIEGEYPTWSPDGKRLAFMSSTNGAYEIYRVNRDGSHLRRLTVSSAYDGFPAWSPDGKRIAFSSDRGRTPGREDIYTMDPEGGQVTNLTHNSGDIDAAYAGWAPDGRMMVLTLYHQDGARPDEDGVYVMTADGGNRTRILSDGTGPGWTRR